MLNYPRRRTPIRWNQLQQRDPHLIRHQHGTRHQFDQVWMTTGTYESIYIHKYEDWEKGSSFVEDIKFKVSLQKA